MNNGLTCELAFRQKNGRFLKMFKFDDFLKEYQKFHCSEIIDLLNNTQVVLLQELRNQTQIYNLLLSSYSACSSLLKISNNIQLFKTYNKAIAIYKYSNYSAEKLTESCENMYAAMLDFFSVLTFDDYLLYNEPNKILKTISQAKIFLLSSHMINKKQTKDEKIAYIRAFLCDYEKLLKDLEISMLKSLAIPKLDYHTQHYGPIPLEHPNVYYLCTQKQYDNEEAYFNELRSVFDQRLKVIPRIDPKEVILLWINSERAYNKEYASFLGETGYNAPKPADYDELESEPL